MRVYKFLNSTFALKSLSEKRLKISTLDDLNDPFELIPYDLSNRTHRIAVQMTRETMSRGHGMLCFSADWRDPVLWAHYADKHRGVCIGFEIRDEVAKKVAYVSERLPFPESPEMKDSEAMLFTKYANWAYEEEIRVFAELNDQENRLYFREFDETFYPVCVIAGARCELAKSEIEKALGDLAATVRLVKARAGFGKFEIVEDLRGFRR